jgi:toxin secretion/phage lysis holin
LKVETTWSALAVAKWIAAIFAAQWLIIPNGSRNALIALTVMMGIDLATGLWAAWISGGVNSTAGFKGVSKKVAILAFLLFVFWLQHVVQLDMNLELAGALGYSINEAVSIVENFARIGVPIPGPLLAALLQAKKLRFTPASEAQLDQLRSEGWKEPKV